MFNKLRLRLTLLTVVLLVILYALTSLFTYFVSKRVVMHPVDARLTRTASQFLHTDFLPQMPSAHPDATYWFVLPKSAAMKTNAPSSISSSKALTNTLNTKQKFVHYDSLSVGGQTYLALIVPGSVIQRPSIQSVLFLTNESVQVYDLQKLQSVIIVVGLFGILIATALGFFLSERMLRPIRKSWTRQLEFVADASHELRSPLAVIQSNLGIVMDHTNQSVVDNLEWLNNVHGQTRQLSKLVENLLFLARSDAGHVTINQEPVDLCTILWQMNELYQSIAEMKGITLELSIDEGSVVIIGDKDKLHRALSNLLDNAMKFTSKDGYVRVNVATKKNKVVIQMTDTGCGMDGETQRRVFDRFYTADIARSRDNPTHGTGLGLAIAERLIAAHGGTIRLQSEGVGLGTTATVELPLAKKRHASEE